MKQVQLQIEAQAVINGFCWAYANALLQKLKELRAQKRIPCDYRDNKLVEHIVDRIMEQVGSPIHGVREEDINVLIAHAEEYLDIFQKK